MKKSYLNPHIYSTNFDVLTSFWIIMLSVYFSTTRTTISICLHYLIIIIQLNNEVFWSPHFYRPPTVRDRLNDNFIIIISLRLTHIFLIYLILTFIYTDNCRCEMLFILALSMGTVWKHNILTGRNYADGKCCRPETFSFVILCILYAALTVIFGLLTPRGWQHDRCRTSDRGRRVNYLDRIYRLQ